MCLFMTTARGKTWRHRFGCSVRNCKRRAIVCNFYYFVKRNTGSVYGVIRSDLKFYRQGMSDIVVTIILVIVALTGYQFERIAVRRIDEQQLTTKDYAVVVRNPPEHITDPDVYTVQLVTVIIDLICNLSSGIS